MDGDRKAQFEIYKLYYKAMYNTSLRIVKDTMEAEDIMQEAFLSAFNNLSSFKGEVAFGAWLKRIVINKSIDGLKKNKLLVEDISQTEDIPDEYSTTLETELPYNLEEIKKAIFQLPDNYRVIVSLYLLEGYDHEEIAGILDIQPSSSRAKLSRARIKLQEILKKIKR
ncbi:MAG: RNA polymerase sigma factor [Bacteroidota bacterium]